MILVALAFVNTFATAQSGDWTWISGGDTIPTGCPYERVLSCGNPGAYGTPDQAASGNVPGGRWGSFSWTDQGGNLWLFGGYGIDSAGTLGNLNDLWEFNSTSHEWVWKSGPSTIPTSCPLNTVWFFCGNSGAYGMQGVFDSGNVPGGRDSGASWVDSKGNFWLFGGEGYDSSGDYGWLNDLWEFNPTTDSWAWIGGISSNAKNCSLWGFAGEIICGPHGNYGVKGQAGGSPGGRTFPFSWTDLQGNLWLYGGVEIDSSGDFCMLDDLWELNPSTGQWTWQTGANTLASNQAVAGIYGVPGQFQPGLTPGGRWGGAAWTDKSGKLWLFGGENLITNDDGFFLQDSTGPFLNDRWQFDPQSGEWAWMGGSQVADYGLSGSTAVYGVEGAAALGNTPGGRMTASNWTDANGNLWLSEGLGQDANVTNIGVLNDLWVLGPTGNEWAWMGGNDAAYTENIPPGEYGIIGVPSPGNLPGVREGAVTWADGAGNFWLFGGGASDSAGHFGYLNDLWEYTPPPAPVAETGFLFSVPPGGQSGTSYLGGGYSYLIDTMAGGGFNSPIALTASGLPVGWTATFNPSTVNGAGSFQVNVSVGAHGNIGNSTFTVVGTSGAITETIPVYLEVCQPFLLNELASTVNLQVGTQTTTGFAASTSCGFNQPISFSASGQPSGVTISFGSDSIGTNIESSTMTVSVDSNVPPGSYPVTVTGTSNGVAQQATFSLVVSSGPPPTFSLTALPASLTVPASSNLATTLTVTPQNGFTGLVNLSCACSTLPTDVSYSLGPPFVTIAGTAATSTFTIYNFSEAAAEKRDRDAHPFFRTAILVVAFCVFSWRRRRHFIRSLLIALAIGSLGLMSSCGGSGNAGGGGGGKTNPVSFNVTVTAISGSVQQALTIPVTLD